MDDLMAYIEQHRERFLAELCDYLSRPSISTQNVGMAECAEYIRAHMERLGLSARLVPTEGYPVVFGELTRPGAEKTLLIYGHYDVQPPEPLEAWTTPPFEPAVRDGRIFARGSGDNKGQHFCHLKALEAWLAVRGEVPINVKIFLEGEEEIGSPNLGPFVREHKEGLLAADWVFTADGPGHETGAAMFLGCRGIVTFELRARGANRDIHSGIRGGTVPNPAWELVQLLASMKERDDSVRIAGFYDAVREPSAADAEAAARIPFDARATLADMGLERFAGDPDIPYYHKIMFRPTLNIAGVVGGYTGQGMKTIVPGAAAVKMDIRLVPDMEPADILAKVKRHIREQGFSNVEVVEMAAYPPSRTPLEHPFPQRVMAAMTSGFGKAPVVFPAIGGSGPDYLFTRDLGLPSVGAAYGPWDENNHAPDENITLECFYGGIRSSAALLAELGAMEK
jgi:acetylornithine deacetylase/succinyl-diaminopimelate desuccinylase-like protein